MKILLTLFGIMAALTTILALAVIQTVIKLAPIVALIAVAVVVTKAMRARHQPAALPVWMGPPPVAWRPARTVVDAEVVAGGQRG